MERIVSNHPLQHIKIIDTAVIELCYFHLKLYECIILLPYVGEIKIINTLMTLTMVTTDCSDEVMMVFARFFRYVFGRLYTYTHYVHAEQPPVSDVDGLISFNI